MDNLNLFALAWARGFNRVLQHAAVVHELGDIPAVPPDYHATMNHPNRNPNSAARWPTASEVRTARQDAALTPAQAGALIYERAARWRNFEDGSARMHPASWELFRIKTRAD